MLAPPTPVWLGESRLFGLYRPGRSPCPPVVMLNSGLLAHTGPYGLYTALAASLAERGIPSLRIDESGKGESAQKPLSQAAALHDDIAQIADFLRTQGHQQMLLLGICSGADNALELAANRNDVAGLVLLDGYAPRTMSFYRRYLVERLKRPARVFGWFERQLRSLASSSQDSTSPPGGLEIRQWPGPRAMRRRYAAVLARPCPTLALFTGALRDSYYNGAGTLSNYLGKPADLTELYQPEMSHLYPSTSQRAELQQLVCDWLSRTYGLSAVAALSDAGDTRTEPMP